MFSSFIIQPKVWRCLLYWDSLEVKFIKQQTWQMSFWAARSESSWDSEDDCFPLFAELGQIHFLVGCAFKQFYIGNRIADLVINTKVLNQTYNSYELTTENMFFVKILVLKYIFYIIKQICARTWTGAILMESKWKLLLVGSLEKNRNMKYRQSVFKKPLRNKKIATFSHQKCTFYRVTCFRQYKLQWREFSICKFRLY